MDNINLEALCVGSKPADQFMSEASTICLKTWYTITPNACSVFIYILAISRISGVYSRAISKHIQLQKVSNQIIKHNTVKVTSSIS